MLWQGHVPFSQYAHVWFRGCTHQSPSWHVTRHIKRNAQNSDSDASLTQTITAADWLLTSSLFHKAFTQNGSLSRSLINTHIRSPYLPCLLQLGCPPLLQDGLHGTDEFCSDILENNRVRYLLVRLCLGNWASVTPLLLFAKGVCVGSFDLCASIHWVNDKELQFGLKLEHVLPYKQSSITKTYCVHYCWDHWGLTL